MCYEMNIKLIRIFLNCCYREKGGELIKFWDKKVNIYFGVFYVNVINMLFY